MTKETSEAIDNSQRKRENVHAKTVEVLKTQEVLGQLIRTMRKRR